MKKIIQKIIINPILSIVLTIIAFLFIIFAFFIIQVLVSVIYSPFIAYDFIKSPSSWSDITLHYQAVIILGFLLFSGIVIYEIIKLVKYVKNKFKLMTNTNIKTPYCCQCIHFRQINDSDFVCSKYQLKRNLLNSNQTELRCGCWKEKKEEEILNLKPGIYGCSIDLKKIWKKIFKKRNSNKKSKN